MRKAVITILGTVGGKNRAKYTFSKNLEILSDNKEIEHINTLPLLMDIFPDCEIIPISTKETKEQQKKTLKSIDYNTEVMENAIEIKDDTDYNQIFQELAKVLKDDRYETFIVDLTHGFRHIPILMIINIIIASIDNPEKIEHILFAKEIDKNKRYEIVDLSEYIGLSKLAFVLKNFNDNYTIGNHVVFKNEKYQELVDNLRIISGHILANSIKTLFEGDDNLLQKSIVELKTLKKDRHIASFSTYIDTVIKHLEDLYSLKNNRDYKKYFELSKLLKDREYLLNSITLLNESVGLYCAKKLEELDNKIKEHIEEYKSKDNFNLYELSHQSKNIIKNQENFHGPYLFNPSKALTASQKKSLQKKKQKLKREIPEHILSMIELEGFKLELSQKNLNSKENIKNIIIEKLKQQDNEDLIELIKRVEDLRNNLSHGNSSYEVSNAKKELSTLIKNYKKLIADKN